MEAVSTSRLLPSPGLCFKPLLTRSTSCVVVRLRQKEDVYLVVSLGSRSDTQVLRLSLEDGKLQRQQGQGSKDFTSEADALDFLSDIESFEILERGCALLGYAPIGNIGMILVATRLRSAATLPGGHQIRLVAESRWLQVPLQSYKGPAMTQAEQERVENMQRFTLNNAHFFCETADVTRAFPSRHPVSEPSWEFVWNRWMAASLRDVGLPDHCPHLLQGVVESRTLVDANFEKYMLVLLSRRSRLHPGMRYIARGLNSLASPGNEIECEQLLFTCPEGEEAVQWSSYVWRRGTVPIWWGVELKSGGVGEATINVNARNPYRGTRRYFRRLQKRYQADLGLPHSQQNGSANSISSSAEDSEEEPSTDDAASVPISCINLLRCNMQRKDELLLSEHFSEGVRRVRKSLPGAPLKVFNFDWHGTMKELKEQATVEGLWALLESIVPQTDISVGSLQERQATGSAASVSGRQAITEWDPKWNAHWQSQQCGVVRYNCADSLDRTNAASYFAAVQVMAEQARRVGISIENAPTATRPAARRNPTRDLGGALQISSIHQKVRNMMKAKDAEAGQRAASPPPATSSVLPHGWEERIDPTSGRKFYIDHNSKITTWQRPDKALAEPLQHTAAQPSTSTEEAQDATDGTLAAASNQAAQLHDMELSDGKDTRWGIFGLSVEEMRQRLRADLVAAHAEIFLINGDINSNLYTSSRAMHSAIIGLLQGESGAVSKAGVGKLANLGVTLQRRWANVLSDATRQVVVECFLGLRLKEHFPTQTLVYGGEQGVPLDEPEEEDDDLEDSTIAPAKDKASQPPDLTNQFHLSAVDPRSTGESAPTPESGVSIPSGDPGAFLSPAVEASGIRAQEMGQHPLS